MGRELTTADLTAMSAPYSEELAGVNRQQALAQALLQQGQQLPQGQMIGNRYVKPSPLQGVNSLLQTAVGMYGQNQAEKKQLDIAKQLREQKMGVLENINLALDKGDLATARKIATANPEYAKDFAAPLIANAIPKIQEPKVVGNYMVDSTGKVLFKAPKEYAPHAVQMVDTPSGFVQFDPNTRSVTPVMVNGQPMMGKSAEPQKFKDTRYTLNQLGDATKDYLAELKDVDVRTLNPLSQKAADLQTKFTNVQMQVKGLYELGAITGPDLKLLNQAITNPNSLMGRVRGGDTLQGQVKVMDDIIRRSEKNLYKTYNLPVPQNLQDVEQPANKPSAPAKKGGIPVGVTQAEWNAMSDADKKLFE